MTINLSQLLCYKLFSIVKLNEQWMDKHMELLDLSRTQWKIIARFNFLPEPCTQQQLLTSIGIDRAHLTRALMQLEKKGLIKKEKLPSDNRAYTIILTSQGKAILAKIEEILKLESEILLRGLTEAEQSQLKEHVSKMESNISSSLSAIHSK